MKNIQKNNSVKKAFKVGNKTKEYPANWNSFYLSELVDILDNKRIPLNSMEREASRANSEETIPYYGATGKVDVVGDFIFDQELLIIGEDGAPFFERNRDVAYIVEGKSWVNNHAHVLSSNEKSNNYYLKCYLNLFNYKGYAEGGTRLKLNQGNLRKIPVVLPNIEEQEKIANFLSERESYLQSIQTLISKMEQRNQYYLHGLTSGELAIKDGITFENDENTNEVVLNGKTKEVPASFDEFKLGDIIQEENKSKLAVKDAIEGEYPFFNCSETLSMTHNDYLVDGNYIIMSTGGKPSIHYYEGKMAYSSDSYVISTTDNVNSRYLAFLLKANMKRIERCFLGSGLKHLNKKIFKKEVYHLPDLDKQEEIADFLSKNENEIRLVRELYSKEKQVFQWLCEKLVSGKYRIVL